MSLAHIDNYVRDMVTSADVIGLEAEGTDLPRRTHQLPGVAKSSSRHAPDHLSGPTLAYKCSIFKTSASAIRRIVAASANNSSPATCTPRHLASKLATSNFPSDDMILHSFVQNYGAEVLEQSSTTSNKLMWVVALAVLTSAVIAFARKWKSHPAIVATPPELPDVEVDVFRERVRRETENDDWE